MIQRIQTLYLAVSVVLTAALFALSLAEIANNGAVYQYNLNGISLNGEITKSGIGGEIVALLALLIHAAAVFLFKNRILQKKVVLLGMITLIGLFGLVFYTAYFSFTGAKISFQTGFIFPIVAVIVDYLAIRGINKDEALIRSIDRIR